MPIPGDGFFQVITNLPYNSMWVAESTTARDLLVTRGLATEGDLCIVINPLRFFQYLSGSWTQKV